MSKTLTIVGIGPGEEGFVTPEVSAAIARATDAAVSYTHLTLPTKA